MTRGLVLSLALAGSLSVVGSSWADTRGQIIPQAQAQAHGLTRAWMAQFEAIGLRSKLKSLVLYEGMLVAQTDRGGLCAYDAETGRPIWDSAKQIGNPKHPSLDPDVGGNLVAVVNGSRLYLLNRWTGDVLWERLVDGAVGAGAALSERSVYVTLVNGMVIAYPIKYATESASNGSARAKPVEGQEPPAPPSREDLRLVQRPAPPLSCYSNGRSLVQPLVTRQTEDEDLLVWPTELGYLMVAKLDRLNVEFTLRYRLKTTREVVGRPAYLPPDPSVAGDSGIIYGVSHDGIVHAIQEKTGQYLWRFSTAEQVDESAAVVDDKVYVATMFGGMFCLDAQTGALQWRTPNVTKLLSASQDRLYAVDRLQNLLILDRKTGQRLDTMSIVAHPFRLQNLQTDRIYLASETGLIQCLHEVGQATPLQHGADRRPAAKPKPAAKEEPAADAQPAAAQPEAKPENQ